MTIRSVPERIKLRRRVRDLQQLLAEILAAEQPKECLRNVLEARLNVLARLEPAFSYPALEHSTALTKATEVVTCQEPFHPDPPDDQVEEVARARRPLLGVVGRDHPAQHDSPAKRHVADDRLEQWTADILEVHVHAFRGQVREPL